MKKYLTAAAAVIMVMGMTMTSMAVPKSSDFGPGVQGTPSQTDGNTSQTSPSPVSTDPISLHINYTGSAMMNLSMDLNNIDGAITYQVYVNHGGFLPWKGNGVEAGGTEGSTYIENIQIDLTGNAAKQYDVYYTGVSSVSGRHGWAKNGQLLGTQDRGEYLYGLQVSLVPKGGAAPGSEDGRYYSQYHERLRIASYGTTLSDYTGWYDHDMNRFYFQNGQALTGWNYIDGLKFYFSDTGVLVQDLDSVIGIQPSYLLKVNKALNCMTIYAQDGANGYIIPVKSMLTSVGDDTPLGTFHTPEKYRWRLMVNDSYTQYATRLTAGQGFLFHSITYESANAETLNTGSYNLLGINRSLGCIRLTCANAKWVYDNCALGTTVQVYEDANSPGPFFKPGVKWIPMTQKWDPTDPAFAGR